jgi:hypothetical protein
VILDESNRTFHSELVAGNKMIVLHVPGFLVIWDSVLQQTSGCVYFYDVRNRFCNPTEVRAQKCFPPPSFFPSVILPHLL